MQFPEVHTQLLDPDTFHHRVTRHAMPQPWKGLAVLVVAAALIWLALSVLVSTMLGGRFPVYGVTAVGVSGAFVIMLLTYQARRARFLSGLYSRFQQGGYVAVPTKLIHGDMSEGDGLAAHFILSHPAQGEEEFAHLIESLRKAVSDPAGAERVRMSLARAAASRTPLGDVFPDLRIPNLVTVDDPAYYMVVLPPATPGQKTDIIGSRA